MKTKNHRRSGFRQKAGQFLFSKNPALCRAAATSNRTHRRRLNPFRVPALIAGFGMILASGASTLAEVHYVDVSTQQFYRLRMAGQNHGNRTLRAWHSGS